MHLMIENMRQTPLLSGIAKGAAFLPLFLMLGACEESRAQNTQEKAPVVIDTLMMDINNDGVVDKIELTFDGETDVDLNIYLGKKGQQEPDSTPSFVKKDIAFHGNAPGQNAGLEAGKKGSFLVKSLNEGAGDSRWDKTLTIIFQKGNFVVSGMTYEERSTSNPDTGGSCEVNFLTGKALQDDKAFRGKNELLTLSEWEPDFLPEACEF